MEMLELPQSNLKYSEIRNQYNLVSTPISHCSPLTFYKAVKPMAVSPHAVTTSHLGGGTLTWCHPTTRQSPVLAWHGRTTLMEGTREGK